jgi:hypothetical protein
MGEPQIGEGIALAHW